MIRNNSSTFSFSIIPKGCFLCKFKSLQRIGDASLGDASGGITENEKNFDDNKMQGPLENNYPISDNYDVFVKDLDYGHLYKKYCSMSIWKRTLHQVKYWFKSRQGANEE